MNISEAKRHWDWQFMSLSDVTPTKGLADFLARAKEQIKSDRSLLEEGCMFRSLAVGKSVPSLKVCIQVIEAFKAWGADINAGAYGGRTPLMMASQEGNLTVVKALIECGADVSIQDDYGRSALHWSAKNSSCAHGAECLLQAGVDPVLVDAAGWRAWQYARKSGNKIVASKLLMLSERLEIAEGLVCGQELKSATRHRL